MARTLALTLYNIENLDDKGCAIDAQEEFGIRNFSRTPSKLLAANIKDERIGKKQKVSSVMTLSEVDSNNKHEHTVHISRRHIKNCKVRTHEVSGFDGLLEALGRHVDRNGPIVHHVLGVHGVPGHLMFSPEEIVSSREILERGDDLRSNYAEKPTIVLDSGFSGSEGEEGNRIPCIARAISYIIPDAVVVAQNGILGPVKIRPDTALFAHGLDADYMLPTDKTIFRAGVREGEDGIPEDLATQLADPSTINSPDIKEVNPLWDIIKIISRANTELRMGDEPAAYCGLMDYYGENPKETLQKLLAKAHAGDLTRLVAERYSKDAARMAMLLYQNAPDTTKIKLEEWKTGWEQTAREIGGRQTANVGEPPTEETSKVPDDEEDIVIQLMKLRGNRFTRWLRGIRGRH